MDAREDEMRSIVEAHYDDVLAYCRRHAPAGVDAHDLAQETFLRFVRAGRSYSEQGKPRAYLLSIARNLCIDAVRTRRWQHVSIEDAPDVADASAQARLEAVDASDAELVQALAVLPDVIREALELRFGQDLAVGEVAHVLGISRFAASRRIKKGLAVLRGILDEGRRV